MSKNASREATQDKILETVIDILREVPLSKITVAEISRRANINRKTFYKYFDTPTQVLLVRLEDKILSEILYDLTQQTCDPVGHTLDVTNHNQTKIVLNVLIRYREAITAAYQNAGGLDFELFDDFLARLRRDWLPFKNCHTTEQKFVANILSQMLIKLMVDWLTADVLLPVPQLLHRADILFKTSISDLNQPQNR
ncbi:TetR/AcrR family transcriptional regulator [Leuconostoc falkenbergense]|uniref:TetR/AcrR family transcriptional regulator n=1 Tax=Leuconostoc falkenbergense TaxID=2766470 RepID=A0A9X3EJ33_9LACO|nr:TetR/AcrR family transcriptional regulator [Leuconostoc falkenbergense]MCX7579765.1 TetR/AcrR family transcriptional regulator [Leuconostoc falkenbergense]